MLGAVALLLSRWVPPFYLLIVPAIFLQKAHNLAPIYHAWARADFRRVMLQNKLRYVWAPLTTFIICLLVGLASGITGNQALSYCLLVPFTFWNLHHFAAQNFGLLSLYRNRQGPESLAQRRLDKFFCFFMMLVAVPAMIYTANWSPFLTGMILPLAKPAFAAEGARIAFAAVTLALTAWMVAHELRRRRDVSKPRLLLILQVGLPAAIGFWQPLFFWTSVAVNHWFASIGINAHAYSVHRRGIAFEARAMALALAGYALLIPFSSAALELLAHHRALALDQVLQSVLAASFTGQTAVHFLYDRHLFKLSRPEVRETIGRDLLVT